MSEKKMASNFDWVNARAACSPVKVFEQLRIQVTNDIERRNEIRGTTSYKFDMGIEQGMFFVFIDPWPTKPVPYRSIKFHLHGDQIIVRDGDDTDILVASLALSDEGDCRLRIKDKLYELWQVRNMALEKLFFDIYRPS
jgi:hypothetical protein